MSQVWIKEDGRAYDAERCSVQECEGAPLYRCGSDAYCRQHREKAVARLKQRTVHLEVKENAWGEWMRQRDAQTKRQASARATSRYRKAR